MTAQVTATYRFGEGTPQGILCIGVGMCLFVLQDAMMKSLLGPHPVWVLICVRSLLTSLVLIPAILYLGPPHRLLTPLWPYHVVRALLFAIGFSLYYTAFPFMTLASVTTIFFSAPLITALFAAMFLKEKIGIYRISALVLGFIGVIIAMKPGSDSFQWVSVLPLICSVTYATSQIIVRKIGDRETSVTTGVYTIVLAGLFVLPIGGAINALTDFADLAPHLRWEWNISLADEGLSLLALGVLGMVGYILISRAYQVSDASAIAPFEYIYLPIAALVGYVFWQEIPTWNTLLGMGLIIVSGLYIGYRELISARRRVSPAPTGETVFVPGNPGQDFAFSHEPTDNR